MKPTNPKDAIAGDKAKLGVWPATATLHGSLGITEGLIKYGAYNWRCAGAQASIYHDAALRHLESWWEGEEHDPKTGVHHLGNALACLAILLDAQLCGSLNDDRPPTFNFAQHVRDAEARIRHLKQLFSDKNPRHFNIRDQVYKQKYPVQENTLHGNMSLVRMLRAGGKAAHLSRDGAEVLTDGMTPNATGCHVECPCRESVYEKLEPFPGPAVDIKPVEPTYPGWRDSDGA